MDNKNDNDFTFEYLCASIVIGMILGFIALYLLL